MFWLYYIFGKCDCRCHAATFAYFGFAKGSFRLLFFSRLIIQIDVKRAVVRDVGGGAAIGGVLSSSLDKVKADRISDAKVFVGGLHPDTDEDDLKQAFSRFGEVLNVSVMRVKETGQSRRYAFVEFLGKESAELACDSSEVYIKDRNVEIRSAHPKSRVQSSNKAIVGSSIPITESSENYTAWMEYLRANPEYYEKLMSAYASNPEALNVYYQQLYGMQDAPNRPSYNIEESSARGDLKSAEKSKDRVLSGKDSHGFYDSSNRSDERRRGRSRSPPAVRAENDRESRRGHKKHAIEDKNKDSSIGRSKYRESGRSSEDRGDGHIKKMRSSDDYIRGHYSRSKRDSYPSSSLSFRETDKSRRIVSTSRDQSVSHDRHDGKRDVRDTRKTPRRSGD